MRCTLPRDEPDPPVEDFLDVYKRQEVVGYLKGKSAIEIAKHFEKVRKITGAKYSVIDSKTHEWEFGNLLAYKIIIRK